MWRCWFSHQWSKWTITYDSHHQVRYCSRCGLIKARSFY